jgi:DNA-binding MarR family transcriptional regulator
MAKVNTMTLPYDLTTLPEQALDVLRYMGKVRLDRADADQLMEGIGLSERSFSKAIKRLVTKNYITMDGLRIYHLTPKGHQAINDLKEHDATAPAGAPSGGAHTLNYDLCVVVPGMVRSREVNTLLLGLEPVEGEVIRNTADLILRLEMIGGEVEPREFSAPVSPDFSVLMAEFTVKPTATIGDVRLRVEAYQALAMEDLEDIGGMYFDIPLDQDIPRPRAIHTTLEIID